MRLKTIMGKTQILVLEDEKSRMRWFSKTAVNSDISFTALPARAIHLLKEKEFDQIFLDHDLAPKHYASNERDDENTGFAVAQFLANNPDINKDAQIIIHSLNPSGSERMRRVLHKARRNYKKIPFTTLKELAKR